MRALRLTILLALPVAGCGRSGSGDEEAVVRRDSAGIKIVESSRPAWDATSAWRVDSLPSVAIGRVEGPDEEVLYDVVAARYAPDAILVAEPKELRLYDRAGHFLRRLGGAGDGPGEFRRVQSALACADRLWASDILRPRITLFQPDSGPQTFDLPPLASLGMLRGLDLEACSADGLLVQTDGPRTDTPARTVARPVRLLLRLAAADGALDTLLALPGAEWLDGLSVPFGRATLLAATSDRIYVADNGSPEVRSYDLAGRLRRIVRLAVAQRPVTAADVDRIREQYLGHVPPSAEREIRPLFEAAPIPDSMPYFSSLLVAPAGTLWLRDYQPFRDEEVTGWTVIDGSGAWLGAVRLPSGFTPTDFAADGVLGLWQDENDVEFIREYAIRR